MIRDAFWQIVWRLVSAACGFGIVLILAPYLDPAIYGDYNTIIKYFVLWSALSEFGLYVVGLTRLGGHTQTSLDEKSLATWHNMLTTRILLVIVVFLWALVLAYLIPWYTSNPYIMYGLPFGMIFSATVMLSNVVQLPLQLHLRMHHASLAITLSRVVQLLLTIGIILLYPVFSMTAWIRIMWVTALSGIIQCVYTAWRSHRYMSLRLRFVFPDIRSLLRDTAPYGIAHFLGSFQAVLVLWFLSLLYPTIQGYTIVWLWALALAFYEILLVVPLSLANSFMHNIEPKQIKKGFGVLATFFLWLALLIGLNIYLFARDIIALVPDTSYLSALYAPKEFVEIRFLSYGSDFVSVSLLPALWLIFGWWLILAVLFAKKLPWLIKALMTWCLGFVVIVYSYMQYGQIAIFDRGVVGADMLLVLMMPALWAHFAKQLWHYILVKAWHKTSLLTLNLVGILVWVAIALLWIYQWWAMGAIFSHLMLEAILWLYTMVYGRSSSLTIDISWWRHICIVIVFLLVGWWVSFVYHHQEHGMTIWIATLVWLNLLIAGVSYPFLKQTWRKIAKR